MSAVSDRSRNPKEGSIMQQVQDRVVVRMRRYLRGWRVPVIASSLLACVFLADQAQALQGLHLVGSTSDGKLWHTVSQTDGSWSSFGDILNETGAPWHSLLSQTEIADITIQTVSNDVLLLVLIKHTPLSLCEIFGIGTCPEKRPIADGQLTLDQQPSSYPSGPHRDPYLERKQLTLDQQPSSYSVWQTFWRPSGWEPFVDVTSELGNLVFRLGNLAFRRIRLAAIEQGSSLIYLCGATKEGGIFLFSKWIGESPWRDARDLKAEAQFDPGQVTDVSCTPSKFAGGLSVAAVANGRVYHTFASYSSPKAYKNVPITEVGMDNLTTRIGIPELMQEADVAATDRYTELHLVVSSPDTSQYHSLTHFPPDTATGWTGAGNVSSVVGRPGRVVATAIANVRGDLHLYNVTDDGEIWGTARWSSDGRWTSSLDGTRPGFAPLKPQAGDVGRFTNVAVSYSFDIPLSPKPKSTRDSCSLNVSWDDSDDFEQGYKIYLDGTLYTTVGPLNGGSTSVTIPPAMLEYGREVLLGVTVSAFADGGEGARNLSFDKNGTFTTVVRASKPSVKWDYGGATVSWSLLPNSKGAAKIFGTEYLLVRVIQFVGNEVVKEFVSPAIWKDITQRSHYVKGMDAGKSYIVQVEAYAKYSTGCVTISEPTIINDPIKSPSGGGGSDSAPAEIVDENGWRWPKVGPITYASNVIDGGTDEGAASSSSPFRAGGDRAIAQMSPDDAMRLLRWVVAWRDAEYHMPEELARDVAYSVQLRIRDGRLSNLPGKLSLKEIDEGKQLPLVITDQDSEPIQQPIVIDDGHNPQNFSSSANRYPYNNVAAMLGEDDDSWCTCFKALSHDMCVTSAHCLYSTKEQKWLSRRRIVFQAGSLEKRDVGRSCYQAYIPNGWKLGFSDLDYAVIRFQGSGANCAQNTYDVGYLGWATFIDTPAASSMGTMGYPQRRFVNPVWAQVHYPVLTYQHETAVAWVKSDVLGFIFHKLDTQHGQSGSPLFQIGRYDAIIVRGVHKGSAGIQANEGVRLSPGVVQSMLFLAGRR
jgi:hypothetical protein